MYTLYENSKSHIDPMTEYLGMGTQVFSGFFAYLKELDDDSESDLPHDEI